MMGRITIKDSFFYSFRLEDAVPDDHLVRAIAGVLDLSWVHAELAPYYPKLGRPSIDPVLMILATFLRFARNEHSAGTYKSILPTVGFVAFQSKTRFRTIPRSRVHATSGSATPTFSAPYSSVSWKRALGLALSAEKVLQWMPA
jgi:hypothetical protein